MIRVGDVYTHLLKDNMETGIRECYRPFIVVEVEKESVIAAPLTTNICNYKDKRRVYSTLTAPVFQKLKPLLMYYHYYQLNMCVS